METNLFEKPRLFATLRLVAENPGKTASALAGNRDQRDRTKEVRLVDLTEAGLIEARDDICKGRPCKKYYLTQKGDALMCIIALIEKL